jgi:hypothetical protein
MLPMACCSIDIPLLTPHFGTCPALTLDNSPVTWILPMPCPNPLSSRLTSAADLLLYRRSSRDFCYAPISFGPWRSPARCGSLPAIFFSVEAWRLVSCDRAAPW